MSIEGHRQGHFLTLFFSRFCNILCLYAAQISGERLQDHRSSSLLDHMGLLHVLNEATISVLLINECVLFGCRQPDVVVSQAYLGMSAFVLAFLHIAVSSRNLQWND